MIDMKNITRKMKNRIFPITAAAAEIPPNPNMAATTAMTKNTNAQKSIVGTPFFYRRGDFQQR
jgi:hypothetical protein